MQRTLGDYIKAKREELGLNQTELARRSGVPRETINRIENAKTLLPSADSRRRLAKALGVSHLDLLIAAGEIEPDEVRDAGAEGVVEEDPDALRAQLIGVVRQVRWAEKPELARSLITVAMGILNDQQTAPARRPAGSAPGRSQNS